MATKNISQLRRIAFRKWDATTNTWDVFSLEPDDLGQDTVMSFNIAPRKMERTTSAGTTNAPIPGTFDDLSATVTFNADNWYLIGKAIQNWTAATFAGATTADGQVVGADPRDVCDSAEYMSVIAQGICDDGSSADVEFTRCIPSLDSDIELGTSSSVSVELALNPQIYNAKFHSGDGYPATTYRLGTYNTAAEYRFNATTGTYETVES